jgi:hypothetical protein
MTYPISHQSQAEIVFERESQGWANGLYTFGGIAIALYGIAIPDEPVPKTLYILFGLMFSGAAIYLPYWMQRDTPEKVKFRLIDSIVKVEMKDKSFGIIPFGEIVGFEIVEEKRSPASANSVGINYIHYHVNIRRRNGALWTITSSTKKNESLAVVELLKKMIVVPKDNVPFEFAVPRGIVKVKGGDPIEIQWSEHQSLFIDSKKVVAENSKWKNRREFPLALFLRATYSFSSELDFPNSTIYMSFKSENSEKNESVMKLSMKGLNPVECLAVENLIQTTIEEVRKRVDRVDQ